MSKPTIHILYRTVDGPWGGANQFLKALREQLRAMRVYEDGAEKADIILFNSNPASYEQMLSECFRLRRTYRKTIVNRIDGPISLVRGGDFHFDRAIRYFCSRISDGNIFQSQWSREENRKLGLCAGRFETVIYNAPDSRLFFKRPRLAPQSAGKLRLIASSWSPNARKGFDIYEFLDRELDFTKYEMHFCGNSPVTFRRIRQFPPLTSPELAEKLATFDMFITASVNDPCSNSLLEALHCGLPAVVRNSGGHPEIVGCGGDTFEGEADVLQAIDGVGGNLDFFRRRINVPDIRDVAGKYYDFCEAVHYEKAGRQKRARYMDLLWLKALLHH